MKQKTIYAHTWKTLECELHKIAAFYKEQDIKFFSFPAMRAATEIDNIFNFMTKQIVANETCETYTEAWNGLYKDLNAEKKELEKLVYSNINDKISQNYHYNLFAVNCVLAIMQTIRNSTPPI